MADTVDSPISFRVNIRTLPRKGMPVSLVADEDQKAALAAIHDLQAVRDFRATLSVSAWRADGVRVAGLVSADIVQTCVVTLKPLDARVEETLEALFVPENSRLSRPDVSAEGEILLDPEGQDAPETFWGDTIDVGALAEQYFVLGLDPYPRSGDAPVSRLDEGSSGSQEEELPFAKLLSLKRKS